LTKILIVRFSSIGDIVLTSPVIRNIKNQMYGGVQIHYLTKIQYKPLLENNPYLSKIHTIERSTNEILEEIKKEEFDYIIDLHKNIRSYIFKRKLKILSFTFDKLNFKKWLLVNFGINKLPKVHIVDRYMAAVKPFGIVNDQKGLDYFIGEDNFVSMQQLPETHRNGFIGFAIGAQHERKKLPLEKIISICKEIKLPIVLLGGKEDEENGKKIKIQVGENIYNACGKFSINQSASLVQQSKMMVTHDTGLMHIAAAFKKIIISIWGATVPEFGMYPYMPNSESLMVQASHLKKRPCSKLGDKCKYKYCKCVEEIDEQIIIFTARKIMLSTQ
jgi:ADP-heptose:LPS heptosyltransferase